VVSNVRPTLLHVSEIIQFNIFTYLHSSSLQTNACIKLILLSTVRVSECTNGIFNFLNVTHRYGYKNIKSITITSASVSLDLKALYKSIIIIIIVIFIFF